MLMLKLGSLLQLAFVGISRERFTSASAVDEKDFELFLQKELQITLSTAPFFIDCTGRDANL